MMILGGRSVEKQRKLFGEGSSLLHHFAIENMSTHLRPVAMEPMSIDASHAVQLHHSLEPLATI
jgi:hypothetical protein